MASNEIRFQKNFREYLENVGAYILVMHGDGLNKRGIPDTIFCYKGYYFGCELKDKDKPSPLQLYNLRKINKSGGYGCLVYKSGFDKFIKFLSDVPNHKRNLLQDGYYKFK